MANPLFNAIMGSFRPPMNQPKQEQPQQPGENAQNANVGQQISFQDAMKQLQANPAQMMKQAGYNVPDNIANNPQASVMHLIQSGQIGGPMMRMIQPMLNKLMGGR